MTVPVIVEIIFRFIPSALLVFGFIEINLTAKYKKYIQFIAINTVYLFAGLLGQYMREKYKLEFFDFVLAVALVLIYSIFFHTDAVGYRIFIGTLVYLSLIIFDTITTAVIFVIFPEFSFDIGHLTYPALLFADIDLIIYGILMYFEHCIIKRIHDRKSINKRAVIFMLFPESQVLILCVIMKLIMANTDNATPEIMYFTLICVVICVISDILCYRGLIQNSQLYETKMRNEQLEYERSTQYRYYEKINELQHEIMKYRHDFNNVLTTAMNLYTYPDTAEKGKEMLDNAIRGAKAAENDKSIGIKIKEENGRIYISVSNYADMPDFESTEKLPSTKANKNHGYGTEIIRNIVQKYDGDVLFTCKDRKFSTALSIRIKGKDQE